MRSLPKLHPVKCILLVHTRSIKYRIRETCFHVPAYAYTYSYLHEPLLMLPHIKTHILQLNKRTCTLLYDDNYYDYYNHSLDRIASVTTTVIVGGSVRPLIIKHLYCSRQGVVFNTSKLPLFYPSFWALDEHKRCDNTDAAAHKGKGAAASITVNAPFIVIADAPPTERCRHASPCTAWVLLFSHPHSCYLCCYRR